MTMTREAIIAIATKADVQVRLERQTRLAAYVVELQSAIAALSQPELVLTRNDAGEVVAITRQDDEHRIVETIWVAPLSQPAWRPIAEAPRDELILVGPTKRMGICVAMNHSREGWVTETCGDWSTIYTPTHWQPLPAPPEAT